MKQNGGDTVLVVAGYRPTMATPSPAPPSFPTPSPFASSTGFSHRSSFSICRLFLRFLALLFSFTSAVSLASSSAEKIHQHLPTFTTLSELVYLFIVSIMVFVYSAFQLFKGICDYAHRGILISDIVSDYITFILDFLINYLVVSATSVAVCSVEKMDKTIPLWEGSMIAIGMSFGTFMVVGVCSVLSGYKLVKRIVW